jgi:hypothetical protein
MFKILPHYGGRGLDASRRWRGKRMATWKSALGSFRTGVKGAEKLLEKLGSARFGRNGASAGWRSLIDVVELRAGAVYSAVLRRLKQ